MSGETALSADTNAHRDPPRRRRRLGGQRRPGLAAGLLALPVAFLSVFFVYPVLTILVTGLRPDGGWDLGALVDVVADAGLRGVAWFTLWQALASTALTVLLALPGAFVLARYDFLGRSLVRALVTVPFVLPTVVVGTAFTQLLGPELRRSVWAILLAHVFFNYAVIVRTVGTSWANLDPSVTEAARVLGASRLRAFREVTLPALAPALAGAAAIVFLFSFTSFGVVQILGGPGHATIEVEIYRQTAHLLDLPTAAALSVLQLVAISAALAVHVRLAARYAGTRRLVAASEVARRPRGPQWLVLAAVLGSMVALLATPVAVLVGRSFTVGGGFGLSAYRALGDVGRGTTLFVAPTEAIRNSLVFAVAASSIALIVGGLAAFGLVAARQRGVSRLFDAALMLPLGTSAVTIGFGFLITLDKPPLDLRTSPLLIPLAQALVAVPFVIRTLVPVLGSIEPRLREAAAVLGASPRRVAWEVDVPVVARAALVALGFAFAISLGEFGATLFIARADTPTVPVMIFRALGQPGALNVGRAMAMSTVLMALTGASVLAIERVRVGEVGRF